MKIGHSNQQNISFQMFISTREYNKSEIFSDEYQFQVSYVEARAVTCNCGHTFCFACGENWHDPVRCGLIKKWQKKVSLFLWRDMF